MPGASSSIPLATSVAAYRPPVLLETLLDTDAWVGTQEELLQSLPSWKPLKQVPQADLDQNLGPETITLPVVQSENLTHATSEEDLLCSGNSGRGGALSRRGG